MAARNSLPKSAKANPVEHPTGCSNESKSNTDERTIEVITRRADFLAANRGKRFVTPSFVLLAFPRPDEHRADGLAIRYGITVTKKIGNAVVRNRVKRRFRALLQKALPLHGLEGVDHIMIGRKEDQERDFAMMQSDLEKGLNYLSKKLSRA